MANKLCIMVCEYFEREALAVVESGGFDDVKISTFPADCDYTQKGSGKLIEAVNACKNDCSQIHLLGSSCLTGSGNTLFSIEQCHFHNMDQCFSMFIGKNTVDDYLGKGVHLLTPGWLHHWRSHIEKNGFDEQTARMFLGESTTKLVLLDTGVDTKSQDHLREFANFVNLPFEIVLAGLDFFRLFLSKIVLNWRWDSEKTSSTAALANARRQLADYAMIYDLFGDLTKTMTESEAVDKMLNLFTETFAADSLIYISLVNGKPGIIRSRPKFLVDNEAVKSRLLELREDYAWTESKDGFLLRISFQDETVGILQVAGFAFPEYTKHYLNLSLILTRVCGLVISNSRTYQLLLNDIINRKRVEEELRALNASLEQRVAERTETLAKINKELQKEVDEHKQSEAALLERTRLATLSAEVGFAFAQKNTLRDILQNCAEAFVRSLNVAFSRIWVLNKEENVLELQSSAGIYTHINGPHSRVPVGMYKIGLIAQERKPHLTNAVIGDPGVHNQEWAKKMGMIAFAGYPLMIEDRPVGVVAMFSTKPITEITFKSLMSVSDIIASGIERKQAEKALCDSEERFRASVENMLDCFGIYSAIRDQAGKIVDFRIEYVNMAACNNNIMTRNEQIGKRLCGILSAHRETGLFDAYCKLVETGKPVTRKSQIYEDIYKDRRLKKIFDIRAVKLGDGFVAAWRDVTERKHMEEQLQKLSFAVEQSTVSIVITDTHGNIQYVNPRFTQLTGYTLDEAIGKNPRILKSGKTPSDVYERLWESITSGGEWQGEFCNKKKNGEFYWELAHISPLRNQEGAVTNFVAFKDDITEDKQIEEEREKLREQLYRAQKLESVGTLAGGIAHDFNNLLTAIIGYGSLLQMETKEDSLKDYAQKILKTAGKAATLTQGLLTFSKKLPSNPKPVSVNTIIKEAESLLLRVIREDIKLKTSLNKGDFIIMADSGQIEQVLMNLVTNARDAMPEGGELTISTDFAIMDNKFVKTHGFGKIGEYANLAVSDTGMGMDEKTKEKIFEPFFTTKEVGKGTGLGLATVYGIIKQYDGYIDVYSEPGKGTTFNIYLPLIQLKAEEEKKETEKLSKGGTEMILLADDKEDVRNITKIVLERHGYQVIEAIDGADAVDKFSANKERIHLVLLDVIMPNRNGRETYEAIIEMKPAVKAIFMSGYGRDVFLKEGLLEKGLHFLQKPISPTDLLKKVREILDTPPAALCDCGIIPENKIHGSKIEPTGTGSGNK